MRDYVRVDASRVVGELEPQREATGSSIGRVVWDVRQASGCSAPRKFSEDSGVKAGPLTVREPGDDRGGRLIEVWCYR